jgi:TatD DNase family protein
MPGTLIDSHAHLSAPQFDPDRDSVLARARQAGLEAIVDVGAEPEEWRRSLALAHAEPEVRCVLGLHPNSAGQWTDDLERALGALLSDERVVGIGETGLDYHWMSAPAEVQREVFVAHLRLARETGLPLVVHTRDAYDDMLAVLAEQGGGTVGVLHSFSGKVEHALRAVELGYYVSISGPVTYKSGENVREAAAAVPLDRLLVETDSPYLPPHPHRGERNEPALVALTARAVAEARRMPYEDVARATTENARRLFRLPQGPATGP